MSILACDRQGCENIMCDYYSHTHGYLCYSCLNELKALNGAMTIRQFIALNGAMTIRQFMSSPASTGGRSYEWENYVESEFKSRYEE